jgi:DNA-binding transcriptional ArsR family regulator
MVVLSGDVVRDKPTRRLPRDVSMPIEASMPASVYNRPSLHLDIPSARFDMASFGEAVSDPSRVAMLLSLMDGLARPASELARIAGIASSTASFHLNRLVAGALVLREPMGRHHYFRLAGDQVADALEALALHAAPRRVTATPDPAQEAFSLARTCYKHLAGKLGVAWFAALERQGMVHLRDGALEVAPRGVTRFEELGLSPPRWPSGKPCLDWTERRHHLGGPLGGLLTQHLIAVGWLARRKDRRALRVTSAGRSGFARLDVEIGPLGTPGSPAG